MADLFTLVGSISIDMKEAMTNIESVIGKVNELEALLNGTQTTTQTTAQKTGQAVTSATEKATKTTNDTLSKWSVTIGNLTTQALNKLYGYGKDFFQTGYEYNTLVETGVAHISTLLQISTEDATLFFRELEQFAIETPLTLEGTLETMTRMFGVGIERGEMLSTMQMLGDIALGDTEKMQGLAKALTDVRGNTTLLAQDARQFTERGVPLWDLLEQYYTATNGKYAGWSAGELRASNRKETPIPYEDVFNALYMSTQPGGLYHDAMETAMKTTEGQAERMIDNYRRASGAASKVLVDVFTSDTIPAINGILEKIDKWATENPDALQTIAEGFSDFATNGIGALVDGLTTLMDFFAANEGALEGVMVMLGALAMATGHPVAGIAILGSVYPQVWDDYKTGVIDPIMEDPGATIDAAQSNLENGTTVLHYMTGTGAYSEGEHGYSRNTTLWERFQLGLMDFFGLDENKRNMEESWGLTENTEDNRESNVGGSLNQLNENMRNQNMLFASLGGMPDRKSEETGGTFTWISDTLRDFANGRQTGRFDASTLDFDSGGSTSIPALIASVQTLAGEVQSLTGSIPDAIASGISGISVTGTITTGNVVLNTGALVGQLTPRLNLSLGTAAKRAARG